MTVPAILSLKQAGDAVTMHVETCALLAFGKYPEVEFTGKDGGRLIAVRVPQKSADRQLTRIALTYATAVGKTLTISRDPNQVDPSKPFWGISQFNGSVSPSSAVAAAQSPEPEPAPDPASDKLKAIFALQDECFKHAMGMAKYAAGKLGTDPTLEGISALTAQAMIEASRQGVKL